MDHHRLCNCYGNSLFQLAIFRRLCLHHYFIVILALIGVLFLGIEVNGAKSWYDLGFLRIQPAEFAKFATCMAVAKYLSTLHINLKIYVQN